MGGEPVAQGGVLGPREIGSGAPYGERRSRPVRIRHCEADHAQRELFEVRLRHGAEDAEPVVGQGDDARGEFGRIHGRSVGEFPDPSPVGAPVAPAHQRMRCQFVGRGLEGLQIEAYGARRPAGAVLVRRGRVRASSEVLERAEDQVVGDDAGHRAGEEPGPVPFGFGPLAQPEP